MSNEIDYLREFGDDTPPASEATKRRIHALVSDSALHHRGSPSAAWSWLPDRLTAIVRPGSRYRNVPSRGVRVTRLVVLAVALVLAGAAAVTALTGTASGGQGIPDVLAQVQTSFGDGRLVSASLSGSTLTVTLAAPDDPSAVSATFEAQMLAAQARSTVSTSQGPIDTVQYVGADGSPITGYGHDPVLNPNIPPLAPRACDSAAQALQSAFATQAAPATLTVESVLTLPYAGGSCAFKFLTSDPEAFAETAPTVFPSLRAMGAPNERSFLLEVDDQAGAPQFVYSYTWTGGSGQSSTYIKPGLSTIFAGGPSPQP